MDDMLTLAEAAAELGVTAATLRQQIVLGRLWGTKFGRIWVVARMEVELYRERSLGRAGRPRKFRMRPWREIRREVGADGSAHEAG